MKLSLNPNYKRIYYLAYIINIIGGLFFIINNYLINGFNMEAIIVLVIVGIINLLLVVCFFKKRHSVNKLDLIFMWCYIAYIITFLLLSLMYQRSHFNTYNLMYFKNYMFVPYLVFLIEGLCVEKEKNKKFTKGR